MDLTRFELLCNDPIYIAGVGNLKIPTLREIRRIGYENYKLLCQYLSVDLKMFLDITELKAQYDLLDNKGKEINTLFNLIVNNREFREMYANIFSFFIVEDVYYDKKSMSYIVWDTSNDKHTIVGMINNENFNYVQNCLLQINYLNITDNPPKKYKNKRAKRLAEKLEKHQEELNKNKRHNNLTFGDMVSKFCIDNRSGINILNVYDLTIYQFLDQFHEHAYIKQLNIQDMIYANSVQFSDATLYDPQMWLKK